MLATREQLLYHMQINSHNLLLMALYSRIISQLIGGRHYQSTFLGKKHLQHKLSVDTSKTTGDMCSYQHEPVPKKCSQDLVETVPQRIQDPLGTKWRV